MSDHPDIQLHTASTMHGWKPVIFLEAAGDVLSANRRAPSDPAHIDPTRNGPAEAACAERCKADVRTRAH